MNIETENNIYEIFEILIRREHIDTNGKKYMVEKPITVFRDILISDGKLNNHGLYELFVTFESQIIGILDRCLNER